jgi:hypothetical protein
MLMDALVLEVKDDGKRLEKMLTFRETAYLLGVFSIRCFFLYFKVQPWNYPMRELQFEL